MDTNKIVIVCSAFGMGGVGRIVENLLRALTKKNLDLHLVILTDTYDQKKLSDIKTLGVKTYTLNFRKSILLVNEFISLVRILLDIKPLVVQSHAFHANIIVRVASLFMSDTLTVSSVHNLYETNNNSEVNEDAVSIKLKEITYRLTDFLSDVTVQQSEQGAKRYVRVGAVPKNKIKVIYGSVDIDRFRPLKNGTHDDVKKVCNDKTFVWLYAGRFVPQKNLRNLIKQFGAMTSTKSNNALLLAGKGPLETELRRLIDSLGLSSNVHFLGVCHRMPLLLNSVDAFVLPSKYEGGPVVLMEAAACALPIVSTNVGIVDKLVPENYDHFIVDDICTIADSMQTLEDLSSQKRFKYGKKLRKRTIQNFSIDVIANQWSNIYKNIPQ